MSDDQRERPTDVVESATTSLVDIGGNAYGVAAAGDLIVILNPRARSLTKKQAANLAAWIIMVADLERGDLDPILQDQGFTFP